MARHLTTLSAFGFAYIAGATPFVMPWPVSAFVTAALLLLFCALLEDRDELTDIEANRPAGQRMTGDRR